MNNCRKTVLLTGATGFLGAHVARVLLQQGHRVCAIVRKDKKFPECLGTSSGHATTLKGDLLDSGDLVRLTIAIQDSVNKLDAVVHIVGGGPLTANSAFERGIFDLNYTTTANLLRLLEANSKLPRLFVYLSSLAAMGLPNCNGANQIVYSETTPCNPLLPYERAKLATERLVEEAAEKHGFRAALLRFPQIYGGTDDAFTQAIRMVRAGVFPVARRGIGSLPLIHVEDAARATCTVVQQPDRVHGSHDVYLISEGSYSYDQLTKLVKRSCSKAAMLKLPYPLMFAGAVMVETLFAMLGKPEPLNRTRLISLTKDRVVDSSKFITTFTFKFEQHVSTFLASQ